MSWFHLLSCLVTLVLGVAGIGAPGPALAPLPHPPARELVRQLGDDDFATRELALKQLSALPVDAPPPELVAALQSPNPEVRGRAERAIASIREGAVVRSLPPGCGFARRGLVDRFVAATAHWKLAKDDPQRWQPVLDLGMAVAKRAGYKDWPPEECPEAFLTLADFDRQYQPRFILTEGPHVREKRNRQGERAGGHEVVHADSFSCQGGISYDIIVSQGVVKSKTVILTSLIIANGDVVAGDLISNAMIVSDGDVTVGGAINQCVVVARGTIKMAKSPFKSVLVAGGKVVVGEILADPRRFRSAIKEADRFAFGFVRFFELEQVGAIVSFAGGKVRVDRVLAGRSFADAGVKDGDVVESVNSGKPNSAESLRRLLRDALAVGDATVTVRRGDKTEIVSVSLPD